MAKNARYSIFKESPTRGSWTTGKMAQRLASNWLLECCCGSCYVGQKAASRLKSNDANETGRKKDEESIIESQISPIDSAKLKNDGFHRLTMEEVPLTKRDYGVSKDDEFLTSSVNEEASLTSHKDDFLIDISDISSKNKSSFDSETRSGMKHIIGSLPVLPKKETKSPSVYDEKKASQSDSELGYPASIFTKCSKRYEQQKVSTNIPELIIS